ncbi:hypothetical protein [Dyadobacter chenhuakuii]|uniref:Uncharacterized protein n=1 Tax=Dyadobacter chenhuakuii TaxID=2909339 RepID=A0ABY5E8C7_9BACT|nr:hypothetical protein [Dyadobacter chenhuakuii]UTM21797.1 hypothetical protein NFI80_25320 [Dyadobacter chenhuakuii]
MVSNRNFRDDRYLKIGDVILMEPGTPVLCADCPKYLDENASPYAQGTFDSVIKIDIPLERRISLNTIRKALSDQIKGLFEYYNIPLDESIMKRFIAHQVPVLQNQTFIVPAGLYQITDIEMRPRCQKIMLSSYKPAVGNATYKIYVYQGGFHKTHSDTMKVVVDPDSF